MFSFGQEGVGGMSVIVSKPPLSSAVKATPSGSVEQSASLRRVGPNSFAGSFFNQQFNVSGSIHITVHGNTQTVSLRSSSGSATLTLRH
jgi:hypothetical protein